MKDLRKISFISIKNNRYMQASELIRRFKITEEDAKVISEICKFQSEPLIVEETIPITEELN